MTARLRSGPALLGSSLLTTPALLGALLLTAGFSAADPTGDPHRQNPHGTESPNPPTFTPASVRKEMDTDQDDRISWDEFQRHMEGALSEGGAEIGDDLSIILYVLRPLMVEIFEGMDGNGDGYLTQDELDAETAFPGLLKNLSEFEQNLHEQYPTE